MVNATQPIGTSVYLDEILGSKSARLEASAYGIEARNAKQKIKQSGLDFKSLLGPDGLSQDAHNAFRFRRIYVDSKHGVEFLSSSDIINLLPKSDRFISKKLTKGLNQLIVHPWEVLISRSGTIGNVALSGKTIAGKAVTEDVIRVSISERILAGYIAAFLRGEFGRPQLVGMSYGSVVTHIEPEHLERIIVPVPSDEQVDDIGTLMLNATEKWDEANQLLNEADSLLHEKLSLSYVEPETNEKTYRVINLENLLDRFEGGFHSRVVKQAELNLAACPHPITTVGDERVSAEIRAITKFRKRLYVPKGGIPLLNSKQLFQIDPINRKAIAKGAHLKDLPEIQLAENMIVVTCSGTVGKVQIVPAYMAEWTASQDAHRVFSSNSMNAGYVYAWLASDYGQVFLKRNTYGSVILHIDIDQLADVPIPLPASEVRDEIGNLVLKANSLRNEAWLNERAAIKKIENLIEGK